MVEQTNGRSPLARLLGMMLPGPVDLPYTVTAPTPIRMIPGGPNAAELCMLSVEWDGLDAAAEQERVTRVRDVWLAQVKMDGINAVYVDGMIVGGRDGAPLDCALHCQPGLRCLERGMGEKMVFMGEYVAYEGFTETLAEHRRRRGEGVFWIYDAVPFSEWQTGRPCETAIEDRLDCLRENFRGTETGLFVGMLDFWLLDAGEMRAKAHEVWAAGYEGLVRKRLGSPFVRGRSSDWQKIKQRFQAPCEVVDTMHRDGKLRSIIVRGPEPSGAKPIRLTGGWSEAEAVSIDIGMAEGSAGRVVLVEFELTVGTRRTIRSPKFKGLVA